jgi:trehalose synthase-fused probable maltokinase
LTFKAIRPIDGVESFSVRPTGADQSNTSVVVGDLMLKVYRRVDAGVNPELDMLLFFAEHGFAHVPYLVGWYSYAGSHVDATLGIVQCFVADAVDGWKLGLDETAKRPAAFAARIRRLGEVIGEMHAVLAADAADAAFMPEDPTPESSGLVTAKIDEDIDAVFDEFAEREELAPLAGRRDDAHALVSNMAGGFAPGRVMRTHGDLHLGQTLFAGDDWLIIDFEGEPARPASERRQKSLPLRDVASMLRSLAYLVATLERDGVSVDEGWEAEARGAFLEGYRATAPSGVLPQSTDGQERQLALFELEKAFYELRYELDNRPDFAAIPVQGILDILERAAQA